MPEDSNYPPPFLLRRLAAIVYDTLLVLPLVMVSVAVFLGIRSLLVGAPEQDTVVQLDPHLVQLVAALTVTAFYSAFWLKSGQTLGMQAWRIKLVSSDGAPLSLRQALLRCLVDRRGRYWHDYLSGTELVLLPGNKKKADNTSSPAA
jgi:uncharacterized RDD family membrane protein YckC